MEEEEEEDAKADEDEEAEVVKAESPEDEAKGAGQDALVEPVPDLEAVEEPEEELEPEEEPEEEEEEEIYEYTDAQIKEMRKAFKVYDTVRNDTIPFTKVGDCLRSLSLNPSNAQLSSYAKWLDADPVKGCVKFKEFLIIVGRTLKDPITEIEVLEGFRSLDDELVGTVPTIRLQDVLTNGTEKLYPDEFKAFRKKADPKKKGLVDYANFVARMGPNPPTKKKKKKGKRKGKGKKKGKGKGKGKGKF